MATMLELPRELYLMICSYLKPIDLTRLARVSRDHYLAVQQPLFRTVNIYSFDALVKLLGTMVKVPVVSHISPQQRQRWYKLSDAELRERDIKSLQIQLDCKNERRIVGAIVERCVTGIAHKCPDVTINLTLSGLWPNGFKQLQAASLPNVKTLTFFVNSVGLDSSNIELHSGQRIWNLIFGGSTFPDLQDVYLNTSSDSTTQLGETDWDNLQPYYHRSRIVEYKGASDHFHGLLGMKKITLDHTALLTGQVLGSLFTSSIIPKHLTTLEIINCPNLCPVADLEALATLLQRALQLLQSLKLHLSQSAGLSRPFSALNYNGEIDEHPDYHICNVVQQFGQKIKSLDLALPFACNDMLIPYPKKATSMRSAPLELPSMPREPFNTISQRLNVQGYKYRRLIIYNGVCQGAHAFDEMVSLATDQPGEVSWELLNERENKAVWCMSGHLPVESTWEEEMSRPPESE